MENLLRELVTRLQSAYGDDLVSVVLYGSAASGDYHEKHSDLNVLSVLKRVGVAELERAAGPLAWWLQQKQPAPLFLSVEEVHDGSDVFPIEFLDLRESYRVLHGEDLIGLIQVNTAHHRQQLEHELRSRLLRLRRRFLETQRDDKAVTKLMLESLSTFAALFRHALLLGGFPAPIRKHEIFRAVAERFHVGPSPFEELLEVREGSREVPPGEVRGWFGSYLAGVAQVSRVVDEL